MREIMNYDAEFRREDAGGAAVFSCAALDLCGVRRGRSDIARQARPGGTMAGPPPLRRNFERLVRQIIHYDAEVRCDEATSAVSSHAKH